MIQKQDNNTNCYIENKDLEERIKNIFSENSNLKAYKKLKMLQQSVTSPLAQKHIQYYLNQIREKQHNIVYRILFIPIIIFYFILTIFLSYSFLHPEITYYNRIPIFSNLDIVKVAFLIPLFIFVFYLGSYLISQRPKLNDFFKKYGFSFFLIVVWIYCIYYMYDINTYFSNNGSETSNNIVSDSYDTDKTYETISSNVITETSSSIETTSPDSFIGTWNDLNSLRCWMTINNDYSDIFDINISWSSSASENCTWEFTGKYDPTLNGILYSGDCILTQYSSDDSYTKEFIYNDGTGLLYIGADGYLYWDDWKENAGSDCFFEKSSDSY